MVIMVLEALTGIFGSLLSVGGIVSLIINVVITAIAIMIADKVITHEISVKHSLLMAFVAYLIVPILFSFLLAFVRSVAVIGIILPLVAWIILGEILLKSDRKQKAIVAVIAYAVNILLLTYVSGLIFAVLPF